jgi:phage protein U
MMCLGQFVFALESAPYQSAQQQAGWRHPANSRVGLRPARQFLGCDEESITLAGVLLPEITGGETTLDELREMADEGGGYVLIDGSGTLFGVFVIESIDVTRTVFFTDGVARRIEFSLALKRVDDDAVNPSARTSGAAAMAL